MSEKKSFVTGTQELMSDEEEFEEGFKVKTPVWRSKSFNDLNKKLDERRDH